MGFEWLFVFFGLLWLAAVVFWIWALVDCLQVPDDSMYQSGTKLIWVLVIVFANWIGAIIYLVAGRPQVQGPRQGSGSGPVPSTTWDHGSAPMPPPPPGTTGSG